MKIIILGNKWIVKFLSAELYKVETKDKSSIAITDYLTRTISFDINHIDIITIRHELAHAFSAEMCLAELDLDVRQTEELFCELIGRYNKDLSKLADKIYRHFKKSKYNT